MLFYCSFLFFLLLSALLGTSAMAVDIPYEQCTWKNKEWTEQLVNSANDLQTSAECPSSTCSQRDQNSSNRNNSDYQRTFQPVRSALNIPPECFFASAVRSQSKKPGHITYTDKDDKQLTTTNYYYCDSMTDKRNKKYAPNPRDRTKAILPQPPCLNEDYIMMTYHSFHNIADCFGFDNEDKKRLFNLFNHESNFILNNKSDTGARCYGQLVRSALIEVNKRIYVSDTSTLNASQIYTDFKEKCPDLLNRVQIPDKVRAGSVSNEKGKVHDGKTYESDFSAFSHNYQGVLRDSYSMDCQVTQSADTCFFYAMYNMKLNQNQLERTITEDSSGFPGNIEPYSDTPASKKINQAIQDFQLPLKLNEMLIIQGPITTTKDGKTEHKDWLMKSTREIYDTFFHGNASRKRKYNIQDLKIQKITVFDMNESTQWDLLYQAYNGGISVVDDELKGFIKDEKHFMSLGKYCKKNPEKPACKNRESLMETKKPLTLDVERFAKYQKLSPQTRKFPAQVVRDQNYLNDKDSQNENTRPLTNHLYQLKGINMDPRSSDLKEKKAIDDFVDSIKGKCGI